MNPKIFHLTKEVTFRALRIPPPTAGGQGSLSGCRFKLQVTLKGEMDPISGLAFDRDRLERILCLSVLEPLDGSLLNESFPNPTNEGLARSIFLRLQPLFPEKMLTQVSIFESNLIYARYPA
jgi:6-pyruvoyltetrahydropterin/6-carboxytetrahydropterin synthase